MLFGARMTKTDERSDYALDPLNTSFLFTSHFLGSIQQTCIGAFFSMLGNFITLCKLQLYMINIERDTHPPNADWSV